MLGKRLVLVTLHRGLELDYAANPIEFQPIISEDETWVSS